MKKTYKNSLSQDTTASIDTGVYFGIFLCVVGLITIGFVIVAINPAIEEARERCDKYRLGSVVTTTTEYELASNDSFTGIVVDSPAVTTSNLITIRNREGEQRKIAYQFLEPVE